MLKLTKKENSLFFKLMVIMVISSFMVTSVPEYSWAHLSGILITDFISSQKVVGDLYRLPQQSKLIFPSFFMQQINNEDLKKEIKQAVNFIYISRKLSGENNKLFNTQVCLKGINEKIYATAEESSKIITKFCELHLNGIKKSINLRLENNFLLKYIKPIFFSPNLSLNKWEDNLIMLKKLGLPVNILTVLFGERIFLCSSRYVLQTKKRLVLKGKKRIKQKTKIKEWKNRNNFCLNNFILTALKNSNSKNKYIINLPQGIRGSPKTSIIKKINQPEAKDEEEGVFLQSKQIFRNSKFHLFFKSITKHTKSILNNFPKANQIINNKFQKKITIKFKYFLHQPGSIFNIKYKITDLFLKGRS